MNYVAVLNKQGGSLRSLDVPQFAAEVQEIFQQAGHTVRIVLTDSAGLTDALQSAVNDGDALLVGGGDGTISAAADAAARAGLPLAALPAGTMNLFARSLSIPLDLTDAVHALSSGVVQTADIGWANQYSFIHQLSIGMHPRLLRQRELHSYGSRWGKIMASMMATVAVIRNPPAFEARIETPEGAQLRRVSGIFISNNLFNEGHLPFADSLKSGVLGLYVAAPMTSWQWGKLCLKVMAGRWKDSPFVTESGVTEVSLTLPKRSGLSTASLDGELMPLGFRVHVRIQPGGLHVVVPDPQGVSSPDIADNADIAVAQA